MTVVFLASSVTRFYCQSQFLILWCVPPSPKGDGSSKYSVFLRNALRFYTSQRFSVSLRPVREVFADDVCEANSQLTQSVSEALSSESGAGARKRSFCQAFLEKRRSRRCDFFKRLA